LFFLLLIYYHTLGLWLLNDTFFILYYIYNRLRIHKTFYIIKSLKVPEIQRVSYLYTLYKLFCLLMILHDIKLWSFFLFIYYSKLFSHFSHLWQRYLFHSRFFLFLYIRLFLNSTCTFCCFIIFIRSWTLYIWVCFNLYLKRRFC
jgi:hypothetical protein